MAKDDDSSIFGFLLEAVSWLPLNLLLVAVGGASLVSGMVDLPGWAMTGVDLYRAVAYPIGAFISPDLPAWMVDTGVVILSVLVLLARWVLNFLSSVAFALLVAGGLFFVGRWLAPNFAG